MKKRINFITKLFTIMIALLTFNAITYAEETGNVAKINETYYSSLKSALDNANEGDIITLVSDTTENSVMNIDDGITIEGNNHSIKYTGPDAAFLVNTNNKTIINNINLEATKRGVAINNSTHNFTLTNSTLTVGERGVTVNSNANKNSALSIINCTIKKSGFSNYEEYVPNDGSRGISLWQYQDSNILVKNSTVEGFAYVINTASQVSFNGTKITVDNSILRGRAGLNIWDSDLEIELTNSEILGINNEKGKYEGFANIVINGSARNTKLNITNTKFLNYENEDGLNNPNALQYMLSVRSINNTIKIAGNSSFTDTTNKLKDVIVYGIDSFTNITSNEEIVLKNNIEIIGGTYSYDVSEFVPEGYECKEKNNAFVVSLKEYDREVTVDGEANEIKVKVENDDLTKILVDEVNKSNEVNIDKKDVKVTLNIKDVKPADDITKKMTDKIKNGHVANYFDVNINVIDKSTNAIIGNLTKLENKIALSIEIPESLQPQEGYTRKYYILREHNGVIDIIETKISEDKKTLTFETDKFSTYALAYEDIKEEVPKDEIENPATEDKLKYNVILMSGFVVIALGGIFYLGKKESLF